MDTLISSLLLKTVIYGNFEVYLYNIWCLDSYSSSSLSSDNFDNLPKKFFFSFEVGVIYD